MGGSPQDRAFGEHVLEDITFESLGEALQDAIDDGPWRLARVTVLSKPKAVRLNQWSKGREWQLQI